MQNILPQLCAANKPNYRTISDKWAQENRVSPSNGLDVRKGLDGEFIRILSFGINSNSQRYRSTENRFSNASDIRRQQYNLNYFKNTLQQLSVPNMPNRQCRATK